MALSRCLCLTLVLWMLGSRPSAGVRTGSPAPGRWWGTAEARKTRLAARELFNAGNFAAAEAGYQRAFEQAERLGDRVSATRMLIDVAASRLGAYHYRSALAAFLEARREGLTAGDLLDVGAIEANLVALYLELWDFDSAFHAAGQARTRCASLNKPYFEAPLLVQLGHLHEILGDGQAERLYKQGIQAAQRDRNVRAEAAAWDYIGENHLASGDLKTAEGAFNRAFELRKTSDTLRLPVSWGFEGALKLAQGDLISAARFTDRAIAARSGAEPGRPLYLLLHQRGEIRMARGDRAGALADFRAAVDLAARWRREVPPSISSLTATDIGLESAVYDSFVEAAAEEALRGGGLRWLEQSLAAVEQNRGASLRRTLSFFETWRTRLPLEYWEVQARLRTESARLMRTGREHSSLSAQLAFQLSEMESETKLKIPENNSENILARNSLIHFQHGLSGSEVLFVFHLGRKASYVWAVTREQASLHRLPPAEPLREEIEAFRDAVRREGARAQSLGSALYLQLFGDMGEPAAKKTWLLSADDALFDLPFAALVTERSGGRVKYLVEQHALELIPDALVEREGEKPEKKGWFLGVGDPIYNSADDRAAQVYPGWRTFFSRWTVHAATDPLARLAGSGAEVEASARSWMAQTARPAVVLRGSAASRARFLDLAGLGPSVIHLATHVLTPLRDREQAAIAFRAGPDGEPEFLSTFEVGTMHVPGALVVLSGCETGAGRISPGAGLLGLTRAWQMAGAAGVIATSWPVADSTGSIFAHFYRDLGSQSPAEALADSQIEMIRSGGWRAQPEYWAAYQLSGGAR